jgi:hypothetical protein
MNICKSANISVIIAKYVATLVVRINKKNKDNTNVNATSITRKLKLLIVNGLANVWTTIIKFIINNKLRIIILMVNLL